jgi:hypothetical protein
MHFLHLSSEIAARVSVISFLLRNNMAYLDPGSGSYLLQLLIAGLLGSLFVIKASWGRIKNFFRRLFSRQDDDSSDEE